MKHFSKLKWVDYVNEAGSQEELETMQAHLDSGCKRCAKMVKLWRRVKQAAAQEANYQPADSSVRAVKAAYSASEHSRKRKLSEVIAKLVFDSLLQPEMAGVRSTSADARYLLYRGGPYEIDIHLEAKPGTSRLSVTGQLMDVHHPGVVGSDVPIVLSNRRGQTVQTVTNRFGEFQGEIDDLGDLELRISGSGESEVVVSLRDALGGLSGGTRAG